MNFLDYRALTCSSIVIVVVKWKEEERRNEGKREMGTLLVFEVYKIRHVL